MPDILIRGMKMPDSCEFCRFSGYGGYEFERVVCSLTGRSKEKPIFSRFDDCPLAELPPHGDLIEAEPIKRFITDGLNRKEFGYDQIEVLTEVEYAPVIVPSNKEEE